jgi:hypothetical protein
MSAGHGLAGATHGNAHGNGHANAKAGHGKP